MANAPSNKNYTLGKGKLYFDKLDKATGLYEGERHLGNAPSLSFNVSFEYLAHYSAQGGVKAKDKNALLSVAPQFKLTLDELNAKNLALNFMGEAVSNSQLVSDNEILALTGCKPGQSYDLGKVNVGIWKIAYTQGTVIHTAGKTVTGGTSSATAMIIRVVGTITDGFLYLRTISGTFVSGENLTDNNTTPGASKAASAAVFDTALISVYNTATPTTFYTYGTDFTIDSMTGRLFVTEGGAINGTTVTNITANFACKATTYYTINALGLSEIEGRLRYVSDNPYGNQFEMISWSTSLTPSGDTNFIGDDWGTIALQGEVLKDSTNHPDNPYIRVRVFES